MSISTLSNLYSSSLSPHSLHLFSHSKSHPYLLLRVSSSPPISAPKLPRLRTLTTRASISRAEKHAHEAEKESVVEDLGEDGDVYRKTLRLVECAMFASVAGLAYLLSNSLAIEVSFEFTFFFSSWVWFMFSVKFGFFFILWCVEDVGVESRFELYEDWVNLSVI